MWKTIAAVSPTQYLVAQRLVCALLVAFLAQPAAAQVPAFPGAEGAGKDALGGRGGDVYHVTSLLNAGAGSLRFGLDNAPISGRTIVFDTGGTIELTAPLTIDKPFITIAGQTAPGDGITLKGGQVVVDDTHDVVIRYIRSRMGDIGGDNKDAFGVKHSNDIIIDHVSASWSTDEVLSTTHESDEVTIQWSIISEALGGTDGHSYGSLINGGDFSYHHNLYAHNRSRNPRGQNTGSDSTRIDFVNNVLYNPYDKFGYGNDDISLNYVGNFAIAGPDTKASTDHLYVAGNFDTKIHQDGNLMDIVQNGVLQGVDLGWNAFRDDYTAFATRFDLPMVTTHSALDALTLVLDGAGSSLVRDAVDLRVVDDVWNYGGMIVGSSQSEVGGWPTLDPGTTLLDTDKDGMPDAYENSIPYLNPIDPSDRNADMNSNGYTDLEDYLNFLVQPPTISNADFDGDGDVDGDDFLSLQRGYNASGGLADGDADGSGFVDAADLAIWENQYGTTGLLVAASTAVPEPSAALLMLLAGAGLLTRRTNRA